MKAKTELRTENREKELGKSSVQEQETAQLTVRDLLVASLGSKRKSRVSEENVKCAKQYIFKSKTYFDCTLDRAPDGQIPSKEWCMLEKSPDTDKIWGYCKPDMNYDKIRIKIQQIIENLTNSSRKMQSEFEKIKPQEEDLIGQFRSVVDSQSDLTSKVAGLLKESLTCKNGMEYLRSVADEWEDLEKKSVGVAQQIERREEKIKLLKEQAKLDKEKEEKSEVKPQKYSPEQIKLESEMSKLQIAEWIQEKEPYYSKDCNGMLNYEEEPDGVGLIGRYFNNPTFSGSFKKRLDHVINFELTGAPPMDGINSQNFSIQWDGFVLAPFRSKFYFGIETEGGAEVYLSGKKIISHRMFAASGESKERGDSLLRETIKNRNDPSNNNFNKKVSKGINLAAGDKYIIRVKYYHSVHDYMEEDVRTYIKLFWSSDEMIEEVIEKKFLYPENNFPAFKLSGIDPELGVVRKLQENDLAYKDSRTFILQDIPAEYRGNPSLKLSSSYKLDYIEFFTNIPINVFIAKVEYYPRPIPSNFENMNQFLSLLEVNEPEEKDKIKREFHAVSSSLLRIYKKKYDPGKIRIPLVKRGLSQKGNPLVVFFGVDNSNNSPMSCGGKLLWLSQPGSPHFDSCNQSSKFSASWGCESGLEGTMADHKGTMWATNNEGIGGYLMVKFKDLYEVQSFRYKDRSNPGEQNSKLKFEFSTGEVYTWEHIQSNQEVYVQFEKPFRTNWVKVTISAVYGTINNGGAFKFFGTRCSPQLVSEEGKKDVVIKPLFDLEADKVYNLGCLESISNSKKLFNVNKSVGYCTKVNCFDSCYDNTLATVYGDRNYSKDSCICKSAVHAGVLSTKGGKVTVCFGPKETTLKAKKKNGIQSKFKEETDLTINFKPVIENERIPTVVGTKFDLRDLAFRVWQPAVVTDIFRVPIIGTKLAKYKIDGKASFLNLPAIPLKGNPLVAPCGKKIKGRDCRGTKVEEVKKINIRFGPKNYNAKGDYKLDYGKIFGHNGQPFGWSRDMKSNMKSYNARRKLTWENFANIVESYVEFPPSKKSKFCSSPVIICDKATYSIKSGDGRFMVRIFTDIQEANSQVDFQVNKQVFAKNKMIQKGDRVIFEGVVDAIDEIIEISTDCSDHCFYSMGRMNMVQIYPFSENKDKEDDKTPIDEGEVCNKKVKRGQDCEKGDIDVLHCVFQGERTVGSSKCTGRYIKTKFPNVYDKCPEVAGMEYCIRKKYDSQAVCLEYCPGNCEKNGICLGA